MHDQSKIALVPFNLRVKSHFKIWLSSTMRMIRSKLPNTFWKIWPRYPEQGTLCHQRRNGFHKAWYAPEHLRILDNQIYRKPVPENLTKQMVETANPLVEETHAFILEAVNKFLPQRTIKTGDGPAKVLSACLGLRLADPMSIAAAWLTYPVVRYRNTGGFLTNENLNTENRASWNLSNNRFLATHPRWEINYYVIVCSDVNGQGANPISTYEKAFTEMVGTYQLGISTAVSKPGGDSLAMPLKDNAAYANIIMERMDARLQAARDSGADLVILVQQGKDKHVYGALKSLSNRKYGLQSLCPTVEANTRA